LRERKEKIMKKMLTLLVIMVVISICSPGHAFDGRPPHGSLGKLPADKEMLFHQAMRGVWEGTKNIHEQIKALEAEIKNVLTASDFSATLFLEKTRTLQELHKKVRETRDEAIAKLASQFTAAERGILAELISRKPGPPPGR
jgi:uncharacterized membrane protein